MHESDYLPILQLALREDLGDAGDVTSLAVAPEGRSEATLWSKDEGVLAGEEVFAAVFRAIDPATRVAFALHDGAALGMGQRVAQVSGRTVSVLSGERTALNFISFLSGIATATRSLADLARASGHAVILDTRKTLPGWRALSKYAVTVGGGRNHRQGLYDMVLIKDNHVDSAGSVTEAVRRARGRWGERFPVEVECRNADGGCRGAGGGRGLDHAGQHAGRRDRGRGGQGRRPGEGRGVRHHDTRADPRGERGGRGLHFRGGHHALGAVVRFFPEDRLSEDGEDAGNGGQQGSREFDLIVLGTGIAGLTAALAAADEGRTVAVVSKEPLLEECNTQYAQGGIVARGKGDYPGTAGAGHHGRRRRHQQHGRRSSSWPRKGPALVDELLVKRLSVSIQPRCRGHAGPHAGGGALAAPDLLSPRTRRAGPSRPRSSRPSPRTRGSARSRPTRPST